MKTIEEIREAAKIKLVGYTEKEIESFVQGAMFMAGQLPQRRSEEWYEQRDRQKAEAAAKADAVCKSFQDVTGLKKAVDNIRNAKTEAEVIDHAFAVFFDNMIANPEYRALMLDKLEAEDKKVRAELITNIRLACKEFNKTHETQLDFEQLEDNEGQWTLMWSDPL